MSGYIKLHRAIEQHWLWLDPRRLQWWIQLLFMASWEPKQVSFGNTNINLKRGQIATTTRMLMKKFMCCNQTVFNFLTVLENDNMIVRETNQKMTLITIINYERYQQDAPQFSDTAFCTTHRKSNRKLEQNKEVKNKEEKNNYTSSSFSREKEIEFFENLKTDNMHLESLMMLHHIDQSRLAVLLNTFKDYFLKEEKIHKDFKDYRNHFSSWLNDEYAQKLIRNNGNQPKTNNKHEARRGTDAGRHKEEDYGKTF